MKQGKICVVIGLMLLAAALGAIYWQYFYTPLGQLVVDMNFEGIILDPEKCPADMSLTKVWKAEPSDIRTMESKLERYISRDRRVRSTRLRGSRIITQLRYCRRQYLGTLGRNGERLIEAFFWHKDIVNRSDWLLYHFDIRGKGYDWSITYEVDIGTFYNFTINAEE